MLKSFWEFTYYLYIQIILKIKVLMLCYGVNGTLNKSAACIDQFNQLILADHFK